MTIQTLEPATLMPAGTGASTQTTSNAIAMQTMMTFDATADRLALITWMPRSGTLTGVEFRTGIVSTAGATFQIQIEGIDAATGNPDGVAKYTNANGTVVVGTADDNVWKAVAINGGTGVTTVKGDLIAIVLSVSTGTPNTVIIAGMPQGNAAGWVYGDMPYVVQDTAAAWARFTGSVTWCVVLNFGGTYYQVAGGAVGQSITANAIGNGAERGMRFTVPFTMRVSGFRARLHNIAATGDFRARLYSGTTTVLAESINSTTDIDGDVVLSATQDNYYDIMFSSSVTLSANTTYYVTIWQKTAAAVAINEVTVDVAGHMNALGGGSNWYLCNRASGGTGAWTETTTVRPDMYLWCDGFDDGAGGGGGGGMRLAGHGGLAA